jgi:hypothetical protein
MRRAIDQAQPRLCRTYVRQLALILLLTAPAAGKSQPQLAAAPRGDPAQVAWAAIQAEKLACPRVVEAARTAERAIVARCSNRQRYLVFKVRGYADTIVLTCAQAKEQLGLDCRATTMAGKDRENV